MLAERIGLRTANGRTVLDRFVAQHRRPGTVDEVDFGALSAYHRCLLLADGTVTSMVEAHALEPTRTRCLHQARVEQPAEFRPWLDLDGRDTVLVRRVVIEGAVTATPFLYATSALVPSRLPEAFLALIGTAGASIGAALLANRVESRRELLWYGRRPPAVTSRAYRIFVRGVPALVITEDFVR